MIEVQETNRLMQTLVMRMALLESRVSGSIQALFGCPTAAAALAHVVAEGKRRADADSWQAYVDAVSTHMPPDYVRLREMRLADALYSAHAQISAQLAHYGVKDSTPSTADQAIVPPIRNDDPLRSPEIPIIEKRPRAARVVGVETSLTPEAKVIVKLDSGRELSLTPGHRVFTPRGWMFAPDLMVGEFLLRMGE